MVLHLNHIKSTSKIKYLKIQINGNPLELKKIKI